MSDLISRTAVLAKITEHSDVARKKMAAALDPYTQDNWSAVVAHLDIASDAIAALAREGGVARINWRDDPNAVVEDDSPQIGRDYA